MPSPLFWAVLPCMLPGRPLGRRRQTKKKAARKPPSSGLYYCGLAAYPPSASFYKKGGPEGPPGPRNVQPYSFNSSSSSRTLTPRRERSSLLGCPRASCTALERRLPIKWGAPTPGSPTPLSAQPGPSLRAGGAARLRLISPASCAVCRPPVRPDRNRFQRLGQFRHPSGE